MRYDIIPNLIYVLVNMYVHVGQSIYQQYLYVYALAKSEIKCILITSSTLSTQALAFKRNEIFPKVGYSYFRMGHCI